MATVTKASPSPSGSSLTSELDQLSMADHTDTVDQAAQYARSVDDVRLGPSSANGNEPPAQKRARVPSDQALPEDEIIVNKKAKPNLSEACAKAYKDLRNTSVRLARFENQRDFYKKYLDLGVVPAFMKYNSVPSIGRNNNVLKTRWDEVVTSMQRKLLNLQHDEAIRLVNETRKKAEEERKILTEKSANTDELSEAKLAIPLGTDKVRKNDKAERLARLTRDMDDKRRTRAERAGASSESGKTRRGKKPKQNFPKAGGSNSRRGQAQRKGKPKSTNILATLMNMIQSYQ